MKKLLAIIIICISVQTAHALPVNYALLDGVTATTDSVYEDFGPENAFDGDYSLAWNAGGHADDSIGIIHWIEIDLGTEYEIDKFSLFTKNSLYSRYKGFNISYNLSVRLEDEDTNWLQVGAGTLIDTHETQYKNDINVETSARYIKFDVVSGSHWAHLHEIEIWGEMDGIGEVGSDPVPEPATLFLMGVGLLGLVGFRRRKFVKKL